MKNHRQQIIQAMLTIVAVCIATTTVIAEPGNYNQQGPKLVGSGAVNAASQGRHVAVSADGNTALIAGDSDNGGLGAVWVFTRSNGIWTQQGDKLVPNDAIHQQRHSRCFLVCR